MPLPHLGESVAGTHVVWYTLQLWLYHTCRIQWHLPAKAAGSFQRYCVCKFPPELQFYTCVFISCCTTGPMVNVSTIGQSYSMKEVAKIWELALWSVKLKAHWVDSILCSLEETELWDSQACLAPMGLSERIGVWVGADQELECPLFFFFFSIADWTQNLHSELYLSPFCHPQ